MSNIKHEWFLTMVRRQTEIIKLIEQLDKDIVNVALSDLPSDTLHQTMEHLRLSRCSLSNASSQIGTCGENLFNG